MQEKIDFSPIFEYIDQKFEDFKLVVATKEDIRQINQRLDEIVTTVRKLDEERLFTIEWIKRIEAEVEKIKRHLQIA